MIIKSVIRFLKFNEVYFGVFLLVFEVDGFSRGPDVVTDDKLKKSFLNSAVGIGNTI